MSKAIYWSKLDNSAKVYPILTTDRFTYVFRVSATFYEMIDKHLLYQTILEMKTRFPSYYVRLKRGLFWYYFEENLKDPILDMESGLVCEKIDAKFNNGYLFKYMYYGNRISLEINHVLTDGSGAITFLKAVIFRYLELKGKAIEKDESIFTINEEIDPEEIEDAYAKHYGGGDLNPPKVPKAYFKKKKIFASYGSGIINSFMDSKQLISLAKQKDASLTQYIVALLTYSMIKTGNKKLLKKFPVNICIPVNLRSIYNSKTLGNFTLYFHTSFKAKQKLDFDEILEKVKRDFKEEYNQEKIQSKLDTICVVQKKLFVKLIPLFIKYIVFKIGYQAFGRKPTSLTISNFGVVTLPESMKKHIKSFSFYLGAAQKHAVAVNSYKGKTSVVFSRGMINTDLEEVFFNFLTEQGIDIEIVSNYWEMKERKFKHLKKG